MRRLTGLPDLNPQLRVKILNKVVLIGTGLTGVLLLFLGLHCLVMPELAAQGYGLPAGGEAGPWMQATGMRDVALGCGVLGVLWKHRSAIPLILGCVMILPIADVAIVLTNGAPLQTAATHLVSGVGLFALLLFSVLNQRTRQAKPS
ncbi:MAG: DUF4267 domain-containing protein [Rhodobacterales bacterium]|nr:DUF4267 domain-containing protein [Rhodobacterales bacterium]